MKIVFIIGQPNFDDVRQSADSADQRLVGAESRLPVDGGDEFGAGEPADRRRGIGRKTLDETNAARAEVRLQVRMDYPLAQYQGYLRSKKKKMRQGQH